MIVQCPANITNGPNDYVEYEYTVDKDGCKKLQDMEGKACYSEVMSHLPKVELHLRPHNEEGVRASDELYLSWMSLCQQHKLIPEKVEFYVEKGQNFLKIPGGIYDKHWVYASMCCFRFADAFARMVWVVVENMARNKGDFTFWQALHYAMASEYTYGSGHSFSYICKHGNSMYECRAGSHDLSSSLAIPVFFRQSVSDRQKIEGHTNKAISNVAEKLGGYTTKDVGLKGYRSTVKQNVANLRIDCIDDLLTPRWTPMYQLEDPTKEKLRELYERANCNEQQAEDTSQVA